MSHTITYNCDRCKKVLLGEGIGKWRLNYGERFCYGPGADPREKFADLCQPCYNDFLAFLGVKNG